jgi:hypothetical protein
MSEWQPVGTAPRNKWLLVYGGKRMGGPSVAYLNEHGEWLVETASDEHNIYPPKFWRTLPALPPEADD